MVDFACMSPVQVKSPCCQSPIRHFGDRRRQCCACHRTWRIRLKKRGRNPHRLSPKTLFDYLENRGGPLANQAGKRRLSAPALQARLRRQLRDFTAATAWPAVPEGELIAIADALFQTSGKSIWTIYFVLLRPITGSSAIITPPLKHLGKEGAFGWSEAFGQLPPSVKSRITALVCDGGRGLVLLAHREGWWLQRCHFHLRRSIANYLRAGSLSKRPRLAEEVNQQVSVILLNPNPGKLRVALRGLRHLLPRIRSRHLRRILCGFLRNYRDYRTYLEFPELLLPTTSNSAESLIGCLRDLQYRAKGFRTVDSFYQWILAACRHRKMITCNGENGEKNQPN